MSIYILRYKFLILYPQSRKIGGENSQLEGGLDSDDGRNEEADDASASGSGVGDDEEEWGGIDGERSNAPEREGREPGTKPEKPPTGEELRAIKDATDLFRSSSFKLQVSLSLLLHNFNSVCTDRCIIAQRTTEVIQDTSP